MIKEDFLAFVEKYGGDVNYLQFHYSRLIKTLEEFESTAEERGGGAASLYSILAHIGAIRPCCGIFMVIVSSLRILPIQ
jgi:hypothetical protein